MGSNNLLLLCILMVLSQSTCTYIDIRSRLICFKLNYTAIFVSTQTLYFALVSNFDFSIWLSRSSKNAFFVNMMGYCLKLCFFRIRAAKSVGGREGGRAHWFLGSGVGIDFRGEIPISAE